MLEGNGWRVTDPDAISPTEIVEACEKRGQLVVQFSRPEAYTPAMLTSLNEACRLAQERLQVRFYGHYGTRFDAAFLAHLPEVSDLAVDCLAEIIHEEEIGRLPKLERLSFGVFELDHPTFLNKIELGQLKRLVLIENRKRNIDLSPLARCASLGELSINGHFKGIAAIATLPRLQKLVLRGYAKANSLDFIATIPGLKQFSLILGGGADIDDLYSPSIEKMEILRMHGLVNLGDLSRLPALSALRIEDQLQLVRLDLRQANLERLWLFNCKNLAELLGLDMQDRLQEFRASGVALNLNVLRDRDWLPTTRSVGLFSSSRKWNDDANARLTARGLSEKGDAWQ